MTFFSESAQPLYPHNLVDADLAQKFEVAEHFTGAENDRSERVVGDRNWQAGLFADALIEIFQQRAAAGGR